MNALRGWLFKLSAAGGLSLGGFEYMLRTRERPPFIPALMDSYSMYPSRKYVVFSTTGARKTYFDDSIVKFIKGFNYIEVFEGDNDYTLYCVFNASKKLEFFTGHVHEGLIAALVDNLSGFQTIVACKQVVATGKLALEYKQPVYSNDYYLLEMKHNKVDQRRTIVSGTIKRIKQNGEVDQSDSVTSETTMINIDWRGLDTHNKVKAGKGSS